MPRWCEINWYGVNDPHNYKLYLFEKKMILIYIQYNRHACFNTGIWTADGCTKHSHKTWFSTASLISVWTVEMELRSTMVREKGRDLTQSYDKNPYIHKNIQKASWQHKTPPKTSITQRLRTDLGRSVGVTAVTPLVCLNRLRALNLPNNRNSRVIERTYNSNRSRISYPVSNNTLNVLIVTLYLDNEKILALPSDLLKLVWLQL